ncbi:hypothetical protein TcCL_Unassigned04903 [Trypanosoma cruzi]|nr:hypothetical protein TcCL_Unassigned04903 [Trypanosoma cruzi]
MRRSLPRSVGDQQPVASVMRRWRKSLVHLEYPVVLPACLACRHAWQLRWRPAREAPVNKTVAPLWHPHGRPSQTNCNARLSTSGVCPHTVDGQAHSAAGWAGGRQSAARWSTRSCGAHVGKRFRRRQRRAGHRSEGGTAPPTQRVPCDPQGACGPVEEWAGVASRLCAVPPLGDRCPGQHQE